MSNDDDERAQHEALLGQVIANKFKLVRLLGAGGMGAVYEAEDMLLKRRVALKLMKPEVARNKGMAERFIREGRAANAIEHKNIVRVFDLAMDDEAGSLFIVQELLSGESLAERLDREGKLPVGESVVILDSVLEALQFAHGKGIVHRDIKPDNVFLHRGVDGEVVPKIIDFGISKVTAEQQEGLAKTQTGTALGTPYYMSPEQIRGDSDIDHRADLWSAGVMAFEMMTGRRPFVGDNYNMLIINIITSPAPDATAVDPAVPSAISQVIARSLRMDRAHRFESARALREALDDAVLESGARSSQVIALTPASVRSLPPPAAIKADSAVIAADSLVAMTVAPPAPPRERAPRSPAVYALGALVVGLAIAGGVVGLRSNQGDSSATRAPTASAPVSNAPPPETTIAIRPAATPIVAAPAQAANPAVVPAPVAATPVPASRGARVRGATASPTVAVAATPAAQPSVEPAAQPRVEPAVPAAQPRVEPVVAAAPSAPVERPAAQPERPAEAPATPPTNSTGPAQPRRFRFVTNYPQ
jgi:serine/threonine protein kinase